MTDQKTAENQILSALDHDPALREHVANKAYPDMVDELAKPGQAIVDTLTMPRFVSLLNICAKVIDKGNELDTVKKAVIYNKDQQMALPFPLPTSQGIGAALSNLTADKAHLLHMAVGLAGEAAEMLEAVVRHVLGEELDVENILEEAGDSTFYLQGLIKNNQVNSDYALVQLANKVKLLGKRYKNGYSDEAAQARADKEPGK